MKKFRIREAQELLEKYLHMRTENTHWFHGLDIKDPMIENLIDRGYFFALPERDDSGRRVFFSVAGCWSFHYITLWSPADVTKAFQCCEKTIPMRHKEIHFVNLPTALFAIFEFAKTLLSEKIKNRFQVHSDESKLRKKVPLRILPKEYGGTVPMAEMIKMYKKELTAVRSRVLMLDNMHIEKKVKHKKIGKAINTIQRNFRKLDID
ncbi:Clavesin-1 [Penaeus vannamei]|uniref:Clavesin-1 n=1 Tax=Penaeus vannamei TaxID=6689 RepID=A0A3R7MCF5_PENVA|nr:Clavesin-1 [Penaeus vannamei]